MTFPVEIGSGATIYIPSFIKDWFRHSKLMEGGGGHSKTYRQRDLTSLLSFFIKRK
jgi:hypothetical protein